MDVGPTVLLKSSSTSLYEVNPSSTPTNTSANLDDNSKQYMTNSTNQIDSLLHLKSKDMINFNSNSIINLTTSSNTITTTTTTTTAKISSMNNYRDNNNNNTGGINKINKSSDQINYTINKHSIKRDDDDGDRGGSSDADCPAVAKVYPLQASGSIKSLTKISRLTPLGRSESSEHCSQNFPIDEDQSDGLQRSQSNEHQSILCVKKQFTESRSNAPRSNHLCEQCRLEYVKINKSDYVTPLSDTNKCYLSSQSYTDQISCYNGTNCVLYKSLLYEQTGYPNSHNSSRQSDYCTTEKCKLPSPTSPIKMTNKYLYNTNSNKNTTTTTTIPTTTTTTHNSSTDMITYTINTTNNTTITTITTTNTTNTTTTNNNNNNGNANDAITNNANNDNNVPANTDDSPHCLALADKLTQSEHLITGQNQQQVRQSLNSIGRQSATDLQLNTNVNVSNTGTGTDSRTRTCCFCWCCCCSCSCMRVRPNLSDSKRPSASNDTRGVLGTELVEENISLQELWRWAESFDMLMRSSAGQKMFREFLRSEYSDENIMFWLACEDIKKETNLEIVEEKARLIYEDFISILSPREVSLDSRVRELINANMIEPTPYIFDEAQLQIYTLMHRDSYPRFLNSTLYKNLVQQTKDKET